MKICYEQFDQDYIRLDLMPQRGNSLRVDVCTRNLTSGAITILEANTIIDGPEKKFVMQPGETATLTVAGQSCSIQYGHDKKIHLSGDLPIAPYYNGFLTAEEDGFSEHVIVE